MHRSRTILGVVLCLFLAASGRAAIPIDLMLVPGGSAIPAGDRIEVSLVLLPEETEALVEVRPYLVPEASAQPAELLTLRTGEAPWRWQLSRPAGERSSTVCRVRQALVLPYSALETEGPLRIAYEVRTSEPDGLWSVQATRPHHVAWNSTGGFLVGPIEPGPEQARLAAFTPAARRVVHFVTNREVTRSDRMDDGRFGDEPGAGLTYGSCVVNIPVHHHQTGNLETDPADWWGSDDDRYFEVESLSSLQPAAWSASIGGKDLLVVVHGFNNSFEGAVLRTAQIQHDVRFPGTAITFSWPSADNVCLYRRDAKRAANSVEPLAQFLIRLARERAGGNQGRIHLLSHSMGSRLLMEALARARSELGQPACPPFASLTLAAADLSAARMEACWPAAEALCQRQAYYYSKEDAALWTGKSLYDADPVGLGAWTAPLLETINADEANSVMCGWGHRYYAGSDRVLLDLDLSINHGLAADRRMPPLERIPGGGEGHFRFVDD